MINGARFGDTDTALMFAALLAFCIVSLVAGVWRMNRALDRAERGNGVGIVV
jgi:hypothetical protein